MAVMVMNEDIQGVLKVFQEGFKPKLFHKNIHKLYLLVSITIIIVGMNVFGFLLKVTPSLSGPLGSCCILTNMQGDQILQRGPSEGQCVHVLSLQEFLDLCIFCSKVCSTFLVFRCQICYLQYCACFRDPGI